MQTHEILRLLPDVYQRAMTPGSPMEALLEVMARAFTPLEDTLDAFPENLRADQADPAFVFYLARFMDLDRFFVQSVTGDRRAKAHSPEFAAGLDRLRRLITAAPELSRLRGTRAGLCRFLEIATGQDGFEISENAPDDNGLPRPFHIRVTAPASARWYETLIARIIAAEKPAYVTCTLDFAPPPQDTLDTPPADKAKKKA
jgi:phage tail-like protein